LVDSSSRERSIAEIVAKSFAFVVAT